MGLDIYLKRYHVERALIDQHDEIGETIWAESSKKWDDMSETEREDRRQHVEDAEVAFRTEHSIPSFTRGDPDRYSYEEHGHETIEIPSALWPDHYFKVGYFRSSYNSGGLNSVLRSHGFDDLYHVFDDPEEYVVQPNWEQALLRATIIRDQLREYNASLDGVNVMVEKQSMGGGVGSEAEAMRVWRNHVAEREGRYNEGEERSYWSGGNALYFMGPEPLKVRAIMVGTDEFIRSRVPAVYLIYESDGLGWYVKALDIVIETCEWVIAQPDRNRLLLHWSG